jgi:ERF superfamily protein
MQRSSESIANLAAALAKAQIELINPEKALIATIHPEGSGGAERTFRYASLASGLDIVRKILGQHEIAIVQTSAIDQTAGIVNLTTVLAHASGEWIASDWPVCAIGDTATPHRMGAALTYARRYGMFTLVGIAGEDDLDAPDLVTPASQISAAGDAKKDRKRHLNGAHQDVTSAKNLGHRAKLEASKPVVTPATSAQIRDQLLAEIGGLNSGDEAAIWAHRSLRVKNNLTAADARSVENAFQEKLGIFPMSPIDSVIAAPSADDLPYKDPNPTEQNTRETSRAVDKSVLAMAEPRRIRDRAHTKFVAAQPCLVCGRQPADAHHLRFTQPRALARKVSDEFTVPLCRGHHREIHRYGNEIEWWKNWGVDPSIIARALWLQTHPILAR